MRVDSAIDLPSGRRVGYADFGGPADRAVLWCHGGPGCRFSPAYVAATPDGGEFRFVGIDRPGYGTSTPQPGRSIADWVVDALAVADHLGLERFGLVGTSTGGEYALAVAALAPERVWGVVPCCAITDMRYLPARSTMSVPHAIAVWDAPNRDEAMAAAVASHGIDGTRIIESAEGPPLPPADLARLRHPWGEQWLAALPEMFAQGLEGYTDDRIADAPGWTSFDVAAITCPVVVLHGSADVIADPIHAEHTASLIPQARLRLIEDAGHFSIEDHIPAALRDL